MARFCLGDFGLIVAFVRWVVVLVAVTSILVGILVSMVVLICLETRQVIMGECGC